MPNYTACETAICVYCPRMNTGMRLPAGPSPQSKNAPRRQEILLVDFASPAQAVVKVRVRIDTLLYVDYLSYHRTNGAWLITAKSFHVEHRYDVPGS